MSSGSFEYFQVVMVNAQLDVDDIGDCAILGRNDQGEEFYIATHTYMGQTEIIEYGPHIPDLIILPRTVNYNYDRIDYSEFKIEKRIERFLNNPKYCITQAQVITLEELKQVIKSPINHLQGDV